MRPHSAEVKYSPQLFRSTESSKGSGGNAHDDADKHEKTAKMHKAGAGSSKTAHQSIASHCERLAEQLRSAAEESDAIAAAYRSLAEKK